MTERENTCAAFVAQANRGAEWLEACVRQTADGHWVCIREDDTACAAGDSMLVSQTSFETLRSLRLWDVDGCTRRADLRIATLEEFLAICRKYERQALIHACKDARPDDAILACGWHERTTIRHDL